MLKITFFFIITLVYAFDELSSEDQKWRTMVNFRLNRIEKLLHVSGKAKYEAELVDKPQIPVEETHSIHRRSMLQVML